MSLAPGQYTPSARCPLFDNGTRFGCALADPSFHPYRTADRDTAAGSAAGAVAAAAVQEGASARTVRLDTARPFNPARLASLLRGATLYLIGDSLTEQHARGTACALGVAAVVPTAIWAAQCWGRGKRPPVGEPVGIDDDGPRVCFVQAGKGIADRSTRAAYDEVVTSEGMRRGSVFVVNEGLW